MLDTFKFFGITWTRLNDIQFLADVHRHNDSLFSSVVGVDEMSSSNEKENWPNAGSNAKPCARFSLIIRACSVNTKSDRRAGAQNWTTLVYDDLTWRMNGELPTDLPPTNIPHWIAFLRGSLVRDPRSHKTTFWKMPYWPP